MDGVLVREEHPVSGADGVRRRPRVTVDEVASGLMPLLDNPVEIVLPTHGEPADRTALERAFA
jgi:hypothetical protein